MADVATGTLDSLLDEERRLLKRQRQPEWIPPMLATLTDRRFSDPDWIFEHKVDGVRGLTFRRPSSVRLLSRNQLPLSFPDIIEALAEQPADDFVVDGEVVAFHRRQTSFSRLQRRGLGTRTPVYYYVFDLLYLDGHDLTRLPLRRRKVLLRRALSFRGPIRFLPHRAEHGEQYHAEACAKGWEGVIGKRASSPYTSGRSGDWLKLKCVADQELVIGGFTDPRGSRTGFGALLVGHFENGELVYAGKVGTGYNQVLLEDLRKELDRLRRDDPRSPGTPTTSLARTSTGWSRSSWPRSGSQSGPGTAGSVILGSSASAGTRTPERSSESGPSARPKRPTRAFDSTGGSGED